MEHPTLQKRLLTWFKKHKRPLPWRETKKWYHVWVSEIMLQQTKVETVIPYYHRFIQKFENLEKLAEASQQEVLKVWEGLGYYSRARNMHKAAKIIVSDFNSQIPIDKAELLKVPGFGPYTVNAVLSIAFNKPYAVMDGNVIRVLARVFEIKDDIRDRETLRSIQILMDKLLPLNHPGEFNEAMMELGATICKSSVPICEHCPILEFCQAYKKNIVNILPFKTPKPKIPLKQSLACIINYKNLYLLAKRPQHVMLAGLWEFPVLNENDGKNIIDHDLKSIQDQYNLKTSYIKSWPAIKHAYTHFRFNLHPKLFLSTSKAFQSQYYDEFQWLKIEEIKRLPLHKAIWKIINKVENDLVIITQ